MRTGTRMCVGAWFQLLFTLIGVDDVNFASPYHRVYKCNCVGDFLVIVSGKNSIFNQAPVGEAEYYPDGIFITEAPEFINLSTR